MRVVAKIVQEATKMAREAPRKMRSMGMAFWNTSLEERLVAEGIEPGRAKDLAKGISVYVQPPQESSLN